MTAKILPWEHWAPYCRKMKQKPATYSMIEAAEHKRIAENAERLGAAMDRLPEIDIPCDTEAER